MEKERKQSRDVNKYFRQFTRLEVDFIEYLGIISLLLTFYPHIVDKIM